MKSVNWSSSHQHIPSWNGVGDFFLLSAIWFGAFFGLMLSGGLLARYLERDPSGQNPAAYPSTCRLYGAVPVTRSADAVADLVCQSFSARHRWPLTGDEPDVCGQCRVFCVALVLALSSMFEVGHKRIAVQIIRKYSRRPLFLIGFFAALSDGMDSSQIALQIGENIASCLSVFTGLVACTIFAFLSIRLRRPVAHLIRDRALAQRIGQPALQESLRIFSALWYWPILLMLVVTALNLLGIGEGSERALRGALLTSALIIGSVFLSTILHHSFRTRTRRTSIYRERFLNVVYALLRIALAVTVIELLSQIWGFSCWRLLQTAIPAKSSAIRWGASC